MMRMAAPLMASTNPSASGRTPAAITLESAAQMKTHDEDMPLSPPHVVFFCIPAMGHLIPMAELAKRLVALHGFAATIITFSDLASPTQNALLASLPSFGISSLTLPHVPLDDLPASTTAETLISELMARSVSTLRSILLSLKQQTSPRFAAFVADMFAAHTLVLAKQLSISSYLFATTNCHLLSFLIHLPALHETTSGEYRDLASSIRLPGCVPLPGTDLCDLVEDRTSEMYLKLVELARRYADADGILANSFSDMEPGAAAALREGNPPVYLVGPLIRPSSDEPEPDICGCVEWLDRQPAGSVLFVCFGSGGTISPEQTVELALGLEQSGCRFIWVIRSPNERESNATFLGAKAEDDPFGSLPEGFVERTKGKALLVPNWVPQAQILAHPAVGGFLSHGGWNSTLESTSNGVPMIVWPMYAEQKMNAVVLTEGSTGIALRAKKLADGAVVVGKQELAALVKELMDGEIGKAARRRAELLKEAGRRALSGEGSSYKALKLVAGEWKART